MMGRMQFDAEGDTIDVLNSFNDFMTDKFVYLQPMDDEFNYEISWQYGNTMALSDMNIDGDLFLNDWMHFNSDWMPLDHVEGNYYHLPDLANAQWSQFPEFNETDLEAQVKAVGSGAWQESADEEDRFYFPTLTHVRLKVTVTLGDGTVTDRYVILRIV